MGGMGVGEKKEKGGGQEERAGTETSIPTKKRHGKPETFFDTVFRPLSRKFVVLSVPNVVSLSVFVGPAPTFGPDQWSLS